MKITDLLYQLEVLLDAHGDLEIELPNRKGEVVALEDATNFGLRRGEEGAPETLIIEP